MQGKEGINRAENIASIFYALLLGSCRMPDLYILDFAASEIALPLHLSAFSPLSPIPHLIRTNIRAKHEPRLVLLAGED